MRRDFLKLCGLAGLGVAAPVSFPRLARAEEKELSAYEGPYYVVFNASGGWDTTYLMDPKGIDGINRLYQQGDILTQGQHKFAPTAKQVQAGMSNEDFYKEFGSELLVL
ncbi:MAG TPA: twin-arginine translocation signal domain-containing protein, partial [Candidatus Saccharimonadia bacterium]|nr:twin-arginine translocation signal domain-containing protein [Candidatus Saccharimonadia bacterium]